MKFVSLITATSFLSASLAIPTKRQTGAPNAQQVEDAINSWFNDVTNVNSFLNSAPTLSSANIGQASMNALVSANDEPNELMILAALGPALGADGQNAVTLLMETFLNVPSSLQNIIDNPQDGDNQFTKTQLQQINGARCCNVLPALDKLWPASAAAAGIANPQPTVPRPDACTNGDTIC
ncbi:hypothetical protein EJ04DRAFT_584462 [Polyplosphaeria fusca]|uniref:Uncharacterized protein n=1 Tax=Polyplosphaeria fusca TaxID=682080 RepID=A0A9P4UY32_9PLEO|nr:hypothetical protein EJ04DRAFT_584462 [Polyplosphaeria fusca]